MVKLDGNAHTRRRHGKAGHAQWVLGEVGLADVLEGSAADALVIGPGRDCKPAIRFRDARLQGLNFHDFPIFAQLNCVFYGDL